MDYSNKANRQEIRHLKTAFLAGFVFCLCFAAAILQSKDINNLAQIDNKLNPNIASVGELAELPSVGSARAKAIAEYRQEKEKAFESEKDLEKVRGIGQKTAEKLKEWFIFE
jgi:competence ComEA-like helix-hairpin-helix protein